MTVINETPILVKIFLNKYEVKRYFLSLENISVTKKDINDTFLTVLSIACPNSSYGSAKNICIEVLPTENGGCILTYYLKEETKLFGKSIKIKNKNIIYTFGFVAFEEIISLSKTLTYFEEFSCNSSLHLLGKKYFLVIHLPEFDKKTPIIINEFSSFSARGKIINEIVFEYGKCLLKNDAINKINRIFI